MLIFFGWTAWMLFALAVLWAGLPDPSLPRRGEWQIIYYSYWGATVSLLFYLQYQVMAMYCLGLPALLADSSAVGIVGLVFIIRVRYQRGNL